MLAVGPVTRSLLCSTYAVVSVFVNHPGYPNVVEVFVRSEERVVSTGLVSMTRENMTGYADSSTLGHLDEL
jgi:hypothetical protein